MSVDLYCTAEISNAEKNHRRAFTLLGAANILSIFSLVATPD